MSTRCLVKLEGFDVCALYKHWDGDPLYMLNWLTEFNFDFMQNRGDDNSYKFAQLLRSSILMQDKYNLDDSKYTGWGVVEVNANCGQEYEYTLNNDGSVSWKSI